MNYFGTPVTPPPLTTSLAEKESRVQEEVKEEEKKEEEEAVDKPGKLRIKSGLSRRVREEVETEAADNIF